MTNVLTHIIAFIAGQITMFVTYALLLSSSDKIYNQEEMDEAKQREREKYGQISKNTISLDDV